MLLPTLERRGVVAVVVVVFSLRGCWWMEVRERVCCGAFWRGPTGVVGWWREMDWRVRSRRSFRAGSGGVGVLGLLLEGGRGKDSVFIDGDEGSSGVWEPDDVLLKAIERRVRSARDGRGVWLADGGFDLLNADSPSQGFCFGGSRSIGEADTVGIAKLETLLSKSLLDS